MNINVTFEAQDYEVEIGYTTHGKYRAATREAPAEEPDVEWEIESVTSENGLIVTEEKLIKRIKKHMIDHVDVIDQILEYQADRNEYEADEERVHRREREW